MAATLGLAIMALAVWSAQSALQPELLACGSSMPTTQIVKDSPANVCLKIGSFYMNYIVTVDQLVLLSIKNGFQDHRLMSDGNSTMINIQINGASPYQIDPEAPVDDSNQYRGDKPWMQSDPSDPLNPDYQPAIRVVPFFTAVILVKEGVVTDIVWDDGCYGCSTGSTDCVAGFCSVVKDTCFSNSTGSVVTDQTVDCDPKIYVGWRGSDANKNILTSSELVPSKFIMYSAGNAFNNIRSYRDGLKDEQTV